MGVGVNRPGAFAEYIALPMTNIWRHHEAEPGGSWGLNHTFLHWTILLVAPPARHDKIKSLPTMERASQLIRGLRLPAVITPEQLCCAAWPEAVGKKIAGHTRPA